MINIPHKDSNKSSNETLAHQSANSSAHSPKTARKQLCAEDYAVIERVWSLAPEDVETLDFYRMYKFQRDQLLLRSNMEGHIFDFLEQKWPIQYIWKTTFTELLRADNTEEFYVSLRRRGNKFRVALVCSARNLRYTPEKVVDKTVEM